MLLSDLELRQEVDAGRLVFEPALPNLAIQSASIDMTLHNIFWRSEIPGGPGVEVTVDVGTAEAYQYFVRHEESSIELAPGEMVLGETAEAIRIPSHLAGWIEGKSGRARHGLLVHCTAPHIAPGWGNPTPKRITLEIVNLGKVRLRLQAGVAIAQLLVMRLGSPPQADYEGRHQKAGS